MYRYIQRIGRFEVVSFVTGFALMAYELAAARLLAPSIGSSTYVWTSVIGVIIAALSIGYAVGGKLADARVRTLDVAWLLLLSAAAVATSLLVAPLVLDNLTALPDPRLQGLVASLLLFALPSFLLGMISPYLVRLRMVSLETSGESVALLSALNSVGGIIGTFAAGFIFFGFLGSKETVIIVVSLLLAASWGILPKKQVRPRVLMSLIVLAVALVPLSLTNPSLVATIDTPSANYRIYEGKYDDKPVRLLGTGPQGFQSGVYTDENRELVFDYTKKMVEVVAQLPKKDSILILGGGAFTLPDYLAKAYPDSQVDVVEIDPELEKISKEYFSYSAPRNVRSIAQDARAFLNNNQTKYDAVLVDVYSDISVPFSLVTGEYTQRIAASLTPEGVVIVNIIGAHSASCAPMLEAVHSAYHSAYPKSALFPLLEPTLQRRQNIIGVYGTSLSWLDTTGASKVNISSNRLFSDNFAPTERLQQQCRHQ